MTKLKTSEIREMSTEDILKKIDELKNELFYLNIKKATASLEKPHKINQNRKDIARMKTVLAEREGGNK